MFFLIGSRRGSLGAVVIAAAGSAPLVLRVIAPG